MGVDALLDPALYIFLTPKEICCKYWNMAKVKRMVQYDEFAPTSKRTDNPASSNTL